MRYNPEKHHRRSIRLKGYDYSQAATYFVTIVTQGRVCLFGEVVNGEMVANQYGVIVRECWLTIPDHFPHTALDAFVVMPNHVHGIIVLNETTTVGARHAVPLHNAKQTERFGRPVPRSIATIIRSFKSAATKHINQYRSTPGAPVWQRNYYEHIIRNEDSLNRIRIRRYIADNPARWAYDRENPFAVAPEPEEPWAL